MICSLRAVVPTLLHYGSSMSQLCRGKDRERIPPDASGEDGVVASSRRPMRGGSRWRGGPEGGAWRREQGEGQRRERIDGSGEVKEDLTCGSRMSVK
jgi:hypothetical protein